MRKKYYKTARLNRQINTYTVYKYDTAITNETAAAKENELLYADDGSGVVVDVDVDVVFSRKFGEIAGKSVTFLDDSSVVVLGDGVVVVSKLWAARVEFDDSVPSVENMPSPLESNIGPIGRATFPAS